MGGALDDARIRIERAKAGRERLKDEIAAWRSAHPNAFGVVPDWDEHHLMRMHDGRIRLLARVEASPPKAWGLLVGDILGDMRSALDYAVYALAVANTRLDPPPDEKWLEFPIATTEAWFREKRVQRKLSGLSVQARDYIESVQPYQPGFGGPSGVTSPLWLLNEMVGPSKHRFIPVFWTMLHSTQLQFMPGINATFSDMRAYRHGTELIDGTPLVDLKLAVTAQNAAIPLGASITPYVAFRPSTNLPASGEVYMELGKIGGPVEDVVNHLEAFM